MQIRAKAQPPKMDMRAAIAPHEPFDADEIENAKQMMRKALEAKNLAPAEIARRLAEAFEIASS